MATEAKTVFLGTGRRKEAVARVRLTNGTGKFFVNGSELEQYCYTDLLAKQASEPISVLELSGQVDVVADVQGSGPRGQAGAIALGLARALQTMNPEYRVPLKKAGLLTRDGRVKERKKAGQPGARKKFQFSKR